MKNQILQIKIKMIWKDYLLITDETDLIFVQSLQKSSPDKYRIISKEITNKRKIS